LIGHAEEIDYRGPAAMLEDAPPTIIVWGRTKNEAAEKAAAACRELGVVERKSASREAPNGGWTHTAWVKVPT
jgi:hypothetical protein